MPKQKGRVTFKEEFCKGCGLCVSVCPVHILKLKEDALNKKGYNPIGVTEMEKCIACISCALMCPDSVITVEKI
ncbi:4Fe-4S dicluster domain-containing protein [Tissierella creatinini]|nr:4Fe-4S dicluster domain-containing protein [Tissierella creatinini]TJX66051.1 4Fe-4S dicluster domain-containing protein [Soehngenia saccharolytica]